MKKPFFYNILTFVVLGVILFAAVPALAFNSGDKPDDIGTDTITWTGQGGLGDPAEYCPSPDDVPDGIDPDNYLLWILTTDGGSSDAPTLHLGGTGSGDYTGFHPGAGDGSWHIFTPYFDLAGLTAVADINILSTGNGAWILTISHGCEGAYENLTVTKTSETSYTRTHAWSIAKSVDKTDLYLYIPGQAGLPSSGTVTWTIDVTYGGYTDSKHNVSGDIIIYNSGTLDAVITGVTDSMFPVYCPVDFNYTLPVGETLTCSYSYNGYVTGSNTATVTTERDSYFDSADIVWGDPTTEVDKTVTVKDISDLFGEVGLGTCTAPNNCQFTYDETFEWMDYQDAACGDHSYDNTAQVIGEGGVLDDDSATLDVHVQCHVFETAYAKGLTPTCFIPTFSNWGWTNYLAGRDVTQTWDLWAAAGQCDTSKGTLVGTVTVTYNASGYVSVTYNVSMPYVIQETHVYAGKTIFPVTGKKQTITVAPGLYTNNGPFSGAIYVIAHAKVGLPDPNFP